jgi:lipopolysaccharide transport system ATP-binding protein
MSAAISVENIGKRYQITHENVRAGYKTLRESINSAAGGLWDRLRGRPRTETREEFWALNDVSFRVEPGEVVGIIGRNGAGKSTLLKILSRIMPPTTGQTVLRGRVGSLLEVGTGFHPELTGRENVFLNGAILGMSRKEVIRKFDEIVAFAEVERFLDTPVKRYSSGMYVRLAFAVAAHLEPEILIVDEVLAVGDAAFQEKCLGKMQCAASNGRTVLYVSHNMASIQQLCERTIWMQSGRVAADGPSQEVVGSYLSHGRKMVDVSVRDWPDRVTNGQARIVKLEAMDLHTGTMGSVAFGGTLRVTMNVDLMDSILDPQFGLFFHSKLGEPQLDVRSTHSGVRLGSVSGRIAMQVQVENVGLYPGEYFISPWIADAAGRVDLDWVKQCSSLRVDPALIGGHVVRLNPQYGKYWVRSVWEVEPCIDGPRTGNDRPAHITPVAHESAPSTN